MCTDNTRGSEVTVEDQSVYGPKLTFESSFWPHPGGEILEVTYQPELYVNFDLSGSTGTGL